MTAQLTSIILDQKTEEYLDREMSRNEADQEALDMRDAFGDLADSPVWLRNLPDGDYTLMISVDPKEDTSALLHLMRDDNGEVMHTVKLELMPIIRSAVEDAPEYGNMTAEDDETLQAQADAATDAINLRRSSYLEGLFAPYIEHDRDFNVELLDMLDFVTYPMISSGVDLDLGEDADDMPLYTPPHRTTGNKFTLH